MGRCVFERSVGVGGCVYIEFQELSIINKQ